MSGYICLKSLRLGGVDYNQGDPIPAEAVIPSRVRALTAQKYIAAAADKPVAPCGEPDGANDAVSSPGSIILPITKNGGLLELVATPDDIKLAVATLQMNANDAVQAIQDIERDEVLILMDALESRKTVKAALADKARALDEQEETEEG